MRTSPSQTSAIECSRRRFVINAASLSAALGAAGVHAGVAPAPTTSPTSRLGVGFIGAGSRAGAHMTVINWLRTQAKAAVDIVAVCDAWRPRAQAAATNFHAKAFMDYRELLADPAVDVVCISTPDHLHGYQIIDAVRAGKHVYCEKPFTHWRQFELAKKAAQEVAKSGRVFQLGTQGMSDGAWHVARKLIADGLIGRPIHVECGYFRVGDWGERGMPIPDRNARPGPDLNWEAFLGDAPKRDFDVSRFFRWRMYEDYAGGPVTDLFPHTLTPVVSMLGVSFPARVAAIGGIYRYPEREVPDTFNMLIEYPEKVVVAVLGTQGNNDPGANVRGSGHRCPVIRGWEGSLTFAGKEVVFTPAAGSKSTPQRFAIPHGEDFSRHWENFLDCCRRGNTNTYSPAQLAYHVQTALIMGMISSRTGAITAFDTAREEIVVRGA